MNQVFSIPLFATNPHACNYLSGESAQTAFVHPSFSMNTNIYAQLISQGFRRSGDDVYQNICVACAACIPSRVNVDAFTPNRMQRRCQKKNSEVKAYVLPNRFKQEHYDLYLRYQKYKHPDSSMQHSSAEEYIHFLGSSWCDTYFVEFRLQDTLIAVTIIDLLPQALSAVYTFFNPDYEHLSPGTYAVLWQLAHAKALHLPWLYVGYWIKNCRKMRYKNQYQPLQILTENGWQDYQAASD